MTEAIGTPGATGSAAVRGVLFDMDGVLVFSEEAWFLVFGDTLRSFGVAPIGREEFFAIYGSGTKADRDRYMPRQTVEEVDAAYSRFFLERIDAVRPNDEAAGVLASLRARGVRTAVATNTVSGLAREILGRTGLLPLLDAVASPDEAGAPKPDPAVLRLAARRIGLGLDECLFTGDSRYDRDAAAAAGVRFVGHRFGEGERVESLAQILPMVGERVAAGAPGGQG